MANFGPFWPCPKRPCKSVWEKHPTNSNKTTKNSKNEGRPRPPTIIINYKQMNFGCVPSTFDWDFRRWVLWGADHLKSYNKSDGKWPLSVFLNWKQKSLKITKNHLTLINDMISTKNSRSKSVSDKAAIIKPKLHSNFYRICLKNWLVAIWIEFRFGDPHNSKWVLVRVTIDDALFITVNEWWHDHHCVRLCEITHF